MICMVAERKWLYFLGGRIEMLGKVKWRETIKASIFTLTRPPLKIMEFLQVKSLWHTLVVVWCPILVKMVILIVNDEMPMTCWRRWERGGRGWRPRWGRTARRSTAHWRWSSWSWGYDQAGLGDGGGHGWSWGWGDHGVYEDASGQIGHNFLGPNLPRTSSIASESSDVNDDFDEPPAGKSESQEWSGFYVTEQQQQQQEEEEWEILVFGNCSNILWRPNVWPLNI